MDPSAIVALTMCILTTINEVLGYTPSGMPKNISQGVCYCFLKLCCKKPENND